MEIGLLVLAMLLMVVGVVGGLVPGMPGPTFSMGGVLALQLTPHGGDGWVAGFLIVVGAMAVGVDFAAPSLAARLGGTSRAATRGSYLGMMLGVVLGLTATCLTGGLGLGVSLLVFLLFPFIGAFVGERSTGSGTDVAIRAGAMQLVGLMLTTGLKLGYGLVVLGWAVWTVLSAQV
ncbi:MAG: DUF456 domain-containing protein [Myxococcota bacterium]|nr:DUF456 domain-containing protein [Myxococcota bacterium]